MTRRESTIIDAARLTYTVEEVAALLDLSRDRLPARPGRCDPGAAGGRRWLISRRRFHAWLDGQAPDSRRAQDPGGELAGAVRQAGEQDLRDQTGGSGVPRHRQHLGEYRGLRVTTRRSRTLRRPRPRMDGFLEHRGDHARPGRVDLADPRTAQWATWQLAKIDHPSVQTWISELGRRLSPATVAECRRLTSAVLRSTVRNRLIAFSPSEDVRIPRRRRRDTDDQVIEPAAFRRQLVPAVVERYRALVAVAGGTGLRWGEAIGLCDDTVDLDRGHLQIIRTVIERSSTTLDLYTRRTNNSDRILQALDDDPDDDAPRSA